MRLAELVLDQLTGAELDALGQQLALTAPLARAVPPQAISFSGGVSEYIFGRESQDFGVIAKLLAVALQARFAARLTVPVLDAGQGIRATVIGASQFTVQVSGKTIFCSDPAHLQIHNLPVVHLGAGFSARSTAAQWQAAAEAALARHDFTPGQRLALAFTWNAPPEYRHLKACADGIDAALRPGGRRDELLLLMIDGDVGRSLGFILSEELDFHAPLIALDGVRLQEFDYVDIGGLIEPPGVVPVIIKSLVFS